MHKLYTYYCDELLFKFVLDPSNEVDIPLWLESEDYPPLPPRKAVAASYEVILSMLVDHPYSEPKLYSIELVKMHEEGDGWWFYNVNWLVWPSTSGADRCTMNVPVMLNGKCPAYEVFAYKDRMDAWFD